MNPQMNSSSVTTAQHADAFGRGRAECFAARERARPDQRFADVGAGGAGDADARQLHAAVRDDEIEQPAREAVLAGEREYRAERQAVHADEVERAEPEDDARAEREERHDDVVGEDAETDSTAEGVTLSRPSVHNSPRSTVAMSCGLGEHRDEIGIAVDQPGAGDRWRRRTAA